MYKYWTLKDAVFTKDKGKVFPLDYDFMGQNPHYVCGMSVPPIMMQKVAERVYDYWLSTVAD